MSDCLATAIVAAVPATLVAIAEIVVAWRHHAETIKTIIANGHYRKGDRDE